MSKFKEGDRVVRNPINWPWGNQDRSSGIDKTNIYPGTVFEVSPKSHYSTTQYCVSWDFGGGEFYYRETNLLPFIKKFIQEEMEL